MPNLKTIFLPLIFSLFVIPLALNSVYADTSYLNSTITDLNPFTNVKKSYSFFYPVFFMILLAVLMAYALIKRDDKIAAVFSIAAMIVAMLLTFIFLSPIDYTYQYSETKITAEQSHLPDAKIVNNTSVVKDSFNVQVIPNDKQFRLLVGSFFSVFSILNGLFTILIFTKWGKGNTN